MIKEINFRQFKRVKTPKMNDGFETEDTLPP